MSQSTVVHILQQSRAWLQARGIASPRLDAELLLAEVLGLTRTQLYVAHDRPLADDELSRFRELLRRRGAGEPVAYLLGRRAFHDIELTVDRRVLIPRPETEEIIEVVLRTLPDRSAAWRIVDVGTGSGAIALALATALPNATLLATDVSSDALEVARENAARLGLRDRVRFVRGDLLAPLVERGSVVDVVVSNPPYVGTSETADMDAGVVDWEPHQALFAGEDGLSLVRRLIPQAAHVLAPGGLLVVEHGWRQGDATRVIASGCGLVDVRTDPDLDGRDRLLVARQPGALVVPAAPAGTVEASSTHAGATGADAAGETEPATGPAGASADPAAGAASAPAAAPSEDDEPPLPIIDLRAM